jgi:hypothetical protein
MVEKEVGKLPTEEKRPKLTRGGDPGISPRGSWSRRRI